MNVYLRHCVIFSPSLSVSMSPAMSTSTSISLSLYRFVALCLCTCLCIFMHVGTYVRTYTHTYAHIVYVCMHVHIHATTNIHLQGCTWNVRAGSIMSIIGSLFRPCCVLIMLQPRNLRPQQGPRFANCQVGFCLVLSRALSVGCVGVSASGSRKATLSQALWLQGRGVLQAMHGDKGGSARHISPARINSNSKR